MHLKSMAPVLTFALLFWGGMTAPARAGLETGARALVERMAETVMVQLTSPEISRDVRKDRMRAFVREYFHIQGIARWVLGRNWRKATADERDEYLKLYEELMIETYVDRFSGYNGETLMIDSVDVRDGKDAIVASTFLRPGAEKPIRVQWRIRDILGTYRVVDVIIEGISMGQTQRSEIASAIKGVDGDLARFLDGLRVRIETATTTASQID